MTHRDLKTDVAAHRAKNRSRALASPAGLRKVFHSVVMAAALGAAGAGGAQSLPGVTDLKFRDLFKLPVGPRGLEPSAALLALDGQRVRIVGYMARQEGGADPGGVMILVPLPVSLGDEDESFADDLPPSSVYVHPSDARATPPTFVPGLLAVTGRLELGAKPEPDGRVSFVRLRLEPGALQPIVAAPTAQSTAPPTANPTDIPIAPTRPSLAVPTEKPDAQAR